MSRTRATPAPEPEDTEPQPEPQPEPAPEPAANGTPCPCGETHELPAPITRMITSQGGTAVTRTADGAWRVPRVFLAAHEPGPGDIAAAAGQYGFEPA